MRLVRQRHAPAALLSRKSTGTYCTGRCVGPRAGLNGRGEEKTPPPYQDLNHEPSNPYRLRSAAPQCDKACVTSGFGREVAEISARLRYYAACRGNFLTDVSGPAMCPVFKGRNV